MSDTALSRLIDALILSRLAGMQSSISVDSLAEAINLLNETYPTDL